VNGDRNFFEDVGRNEFVFDQTVGEYVSMGLAKLREWIVSKLTQQCRICQLGRNRQSWK
jgi:hypothetical protein